MPTLTINDLDNVIAFSIVPFRKRKVDFAAHRKNVAYLARNVFLEGGRKRVIAIGGSSLLHHLTREEQIKLALVTGEQVGNDIWYISGVLPSPPRQAALLIRKQMRLPRPPDAFLLLPIVGVYNPQGVYLEIQRLCQRLGDETGARFILYLRDKTLREVYCRLACQSEHVMGIKIGTSLDDVKPVRDFVGDAKAVIWGIGDISTQAARLGTRGHTSGTSLVCIRASDEINNAQRRRDFVAAEQIEEELREFEQIRFMEERAYNYSAVVEAVRLAGFTDVDPGEGGPFNAPPPRELSERLGPIVQRLRTYHAAMPAHPGVAVPG